MVLLNKLGIRNRLVSNHKFNEHGKAAWFITELKAGKSVAVITDAGTPCISDPGNELIRAAVGEGIRVVGVPGCCAAVNALSVSGFESVPRPAERGGPVEWRSELLRKLRSLQRLDGSFANRNGRYWENDPVLATGYSAVAAAFAASSRFPEVPFHTIVVTAINPVLPLTQPVSPCGSCRQALYEYEQKFNQPIEVVLSGQSGPVYRFRCVADLLPDTFPAGFLP